MSERKDNSEYLGTVTLQTCSKEKGQFQLCMWKEMHSNPKGSALCFLNLVTRGQFGFAIQGPFD